MCQEVNCGHLYQFRWLPQLLFISGIDSFTMKKGSGFLQLQFSLRLWKGHFKATAKGKKKKKEYNLILKYLGKKKKKVARAIKRQTDSTD